MRDRLLGAYVVGLGVLGAILMFRGEPSDSSDVRILGAGACLLGAGLGWSIATDSNNRESTTAATSDEHLADLELDPLSGGLTVRDTEDVSASMDHGCALDDDPGCDLPDD